MSLNSFALVTFKVVTPYIVLALGWWFISFLEKLDLLAVAITTALVGVVIWHSVPHYLIWRSKILPTRIKEEASWSFASAALRSCILLPFQLSAWFVVPIIVLFVNQRDNRLPWIFDLLYGDVYGLHGDNVYWCWDPDIDDAIRLELPQADQISLAHLHRFIKLNYFLPGHWQRSWASRVVWLLKNRCSYLNESLGIRIDDFRRWKYWGPLKPPSHLRRTSFVIQVGYDFELYKVFPLGTWLGKYNLECVQHYGFKFSEQIGPFVTMNEINRRRSSQVITKSLSLQIKKDYQGRKFDLNPLVKSKDGSLCLDKDRINPVSGKPSSAF